MSFLVIVIGMVLALSAMVIAAEERRRRAEKYRAAAERLGGTLDRGGFFSHASLQFALKGQYATMTFGANSKNPFTRLQVLLPPPSVGRLTVEPDTLSHAFLRMIGVRAIPIGDRVFDQMYCVRSRPESFAQTVFAPERRAAAMRAVRRLNHCYGFSLTIDGRLLTVKVRECLDSVDVILAMAKTAEEFMGFLGPVISSEGIQMGDCADGRCPICAAALAGLLHRCDRCGAPHHRECFEYVGRCAIYGCEPKPRRRVA